MDKYTSSKIHQKCSVLHGCCNHYSPTTGWVTHPLLLSLCGALTGKLAHPFPTKRPLSRSLRRKSSSSSSSGTGGETPTLVIKFSLPLLPFTLLVFCRNNLNSSFQPTTMIPWIVCTQTSILILLDTVRHCDRACLSKKQGRPCSISLTIRSAAKPSTVIWYGNSRLPPMFLLIDQLLVYPHSTLCSPEPTSTTGFRSWRWSHTYDAPALSSSCIQQLSVPTYRFQTLTNSADPKYDSQPAWQRLFDPPRRTRVPLQVSKRGETRAHCLRQC